MCIPIVPLTVLYNLITNPIRMTLAVDTRAPCPVQRAPCYMFSKLIMFLEKRNVNDKHSGEFVEKLNIREYKLNYNVSWN